MRLFIDSDEKFNAVNAPPGNGLSGIQFFKNHGITTNDPERPEDEVRGEFVWKHNYTDQQYEIFNVRHFEEIFMM